MDNLFGKSSEGRRKASYVRTIYEVAPLDLLKRLKTPNCTLFLTEIPELSPGYRVIYKQHPCQYCPFAVLNKKKVSD
jgi:hypothetical protein